MNKQLIAAGIIVVLLVVGFSGCIEEKSTETLVTAPVNTLILTLNDLPEGFSEKGNGSPSSSMPGLTDAPTESYAVIFMGNYSNQTTEIQFVLLKFNSSEVAITNHNTLIFYITAFGKVELINDSVNKTGDESKAFSDSVGNTYFYFRTKLLHFFDYQIE